MPETITPLYTAHATAYGEGRAGRVTSDDDVLDLDLAIPKEMGGPGGDLTNPEQMFAAGYAACFHSALKLVAKGHDTTGSTVTASVGIGPNGAGGFGLVVGLEVALPALDAATALALTEKAHEVCPYSNATRGNIDVSLSVAS